MRDFERLEMRACVNLMKFNMAYSVRFCIWVRGIPKHINRWVRWDQPSGGGLRGIDKKLNMKLQWALAQKAICILDCIKSMVSRVREWFYHFVLLSWDHICSTSFSSGAPSVRRTWNVERVQRMVRRIISRLEHLSNTKRLRKLGFFRLEKKKFKEMLQQPYSN